ncbi:hypothetical protein SDC9_55576 [bioreactor metagenome]|uniref:Uncharacterized protein n=1 Tax=bioreactor metagenome TaxID=1076179 RepID=A0A644WZC2_9ZZZZ
MLTVIVLLLYTLVIVFDFVPTRKERKIKGNIVYWSILSISFCVLILYSLDIEVPSPSGPIRYIVEKIFIPLG